jgi:isopentenyl diphosphate isomerase/L-lactate dehydrogenase-like FMN-dependent dehydrogenase
MSYYQQSDMQAAGLPITPDQWEQKAKQILAAGPYGYVAGGAGSGETMKANLDAFRQYRLRPRVCADISKRDMSVLLFGSTLPAPIMLAPIGVNSILHPDAELAVAKAAAEAGIPYILSNVSSKSLEDVAEVMGDHQRWFQLYPPNNREITDSFLQRAERAGYAGIVVTVDSALLGWRHLDLENAYLPFLEGHGMGNYFSDPVFLSTLEKPLEQDRMAAYLKVLKIGNNTCFSWKELSYIKEKSKLPVMIKGITHPEDAVLAVDHGVDGIIVSNHGGRQLDGAVATLDMLPLVAEAVRDKVPVLMDSGIRHGSDVIKAIALGAKAVLFGRPYAYALAVAGERGVFYAVQNLLADTELQLGISGFTSFKDIDKTILMKM